VQGGSKHGGAPRLGRAPSPARPGRPAEREFFIDNLLFIIEMIWWTGLAPWAFEFPFPGSLVSSFLGVPIDQSVGGTSLAMPTPHLHPAPKHRFHTLYTRAKNKVNGFEDFRLNVEARIWPVLSYVCHIRSTAVVPDGQGLVLPGCESPSAF